MQEINVNTRLPFISAPSIATTGNAARAVAGATKALKSDGMHQNLASPMRKTIAAPEQKIAETRFARVDEKGRFSGYASLFGIADLGADVVMRGAFQHSLQKRGAGGVRMLWQHDPAQVIGQWRSIEEDARGLYVRGQLNLEVAKAREIHALLREGALDGLSIGYKTERAQRNAATGIRRLEEIDLWEISLVTFPMLPQARVANARVETEASKSNDTAVVAAAQRLAAAMKPSAKPNTRTHS